MLTWEYSPGILEMSKVTESAKRYQALFEYVASEYGADGQSVGPCSSFGIILSAIADLDSRPVDAATGTLVEGVPSSGKGKIQQIERLIAEISAMPSEVANS